MCNEWKRVFEKSLRIGPCLTAQVNNCVDHSLRGPELSEQSGGIRVHHEGSGPRSRPTHQIVVGTMTQAGRDRWLQGIDSFQEHFWRESQGVGCLHGLIRVHSTSAGVHVLTSTPSMLTRCSANRHGSRSTWGEPPFATNNDTARRSVSQRR